MIELIVDLLISSLALILCLFILFSIVLFAISRTKKINHIIRKRKIDFTKITDSDLLKQLTVVNEELMPTYKKLRKLKSKAKDQHTINDINTKLNAISKKINYSVKLIKKSQIKINNEKNDKGIKQELKQIDEVINKLK